MQQSTNRFDSYQSSSVENNRLAMLQQEQEMTYKAFELQNFYQNKKLNLVSLKDRIEKFKASKVNSMKNGLNISTNNNDRNQSRPDNQRNYFSNHNNNNQSHKIEQTKLERIAVPPSQQQRHQLISHKLVTKDYPQSSQMAKGTSASNNRPRFPSQLVKDFRNNQNHHLRQNAIKTNFDKYQTVHNNPENPTMKREKTEENLIKQNKQSYSPHNKQLITRQQPRNMQFKIQPISTIATREGRYSKKVKQINRSTQKSFSVSQKESRIALALSGLNKKVHIQSQYELDRLQALILRLWSLYQTLTKIMQHVVDQPFRQQEQIRRYVGEVCGQGYQQIVLVLDRINSKRLNRAVKLSRMLQNLSVVYLFLQLTKNKKIEKSHIVNFIGYCTSNIVFLIKILYLVHDVQCPRNGLNSNDSYMTQNSKQDDNKQQYLKYHQSKQQVQDKQSNKNLPDKLQSVTNNLKKLINLKKQSRHHPSQQNNPILNKESSVNTTLNPQNQQYFHSTLSYSTHTKSILNTIRKFQLESYKEQLKSILDITIRMEHNNQIINIVQTKLCMQNDKYFQSIVNQFLKKALRDSSQSFYSYARYIFEFLAFHIAKFKLYGHVSVLEVAPEPYLQLKFPYTIVIEPYQVLIYQSKLNILIRAYAQTFIQRLSAHCNIVFWTDLMPEQIEPILSLFPQKENIYTLYRYHCIYDNQRQAYAKPIQRLGTNLQNIIIIDRSINNFINHRAAGLQFNWTGDKKDKKLKGLLEILEPMLTKLIDPSDTRNSSLRKSLVQAHQQLKCLSGRKKKPFQHRKHFKEIQHFQNTEENFMTPNNQAIDSFYDSNKLEVYNRQQRDEEDHMEAPVMMGRQEVQVNEQSMNQVID